MFGARAKKRLRRSGRSLSPEWAWNSKIDAARCSGSLTRSGVRFWGARRVLGYPRKEEIDEMKKQLWWVLALFLCVGLGVVAYRGPGGPADTRQADVAYRDGSFQAKIDIANGRNPHLAS